MTSLRCMFEELLYFLFILSFFFVNILNPIVSNEVSVS